VKIGFFSSNPALQNVDLNTENKKATITKANVQDVVIVQPHSGWQLAGELNSISLDANGARNLFEAVLGVILSILIDDHVISVYDTELIDVSAFTYSRNPDASQLQFSAYGPIASVEVIDLDCIRGIGFKASERLNDSDCVGPWGVINRSYVYRTSNNEFTGGGPYWDQYDPAIAGIPHLLTDSDGNSRVLVTKSQPAISENNCYFTTYGVHSSITNTDADGLAKDLSGTANFYYFRFA
jgi:hypothetical protein